MNITASQYTTAEKWGLRPFRIDLDIYEKHTVTYRIDSIVSLDCRVNNRAIRGDELQIVFHITLSFSSN